MKRLSTLLILAMALSLCFSACSKDNAEPKDKEITLEGKWIGTDAKEEYYFDKKLIKTVNQKENVWEYVIFSPNKFVFKQGGDDIYELLSTVNETNIVVKGGTDEVTFEYLISGNKLTLTLNEERSGSLDDNKTVDFNKVKSILYFVKEE